MTIDLHNFYVKQDIHQAKYCHVKNIIIMYNSNIVNLWTARELSRHVGSTDGKSSPFVDFSSCSEMLSAIL